MIITTNELLTAENDLINKKHRAETVWQDKVKNDFFRTFSVEDYSKTTHNFIENCKETERKINFAKNNIL